MNPNHPDKLCDRIAGAITDLAYRNEENPKVAVEVLLGHEHCYIIAESSVRLDEEEVFEIVYRIAGGRISIDFLQTKQDSHLADNQSNGFRCGDNGIFRGVPVADEQRKLCKIAMDIYAKYPYDGKYILDGERLIICQSNAKAEELKKIYPDAEINPLGDWTGGSDVDTGAVNRKLGSDMGDAVTGGGLWGKDYSKADVSVNIWCHIKAQELNREIRAVCAIGDMNVQYYADGEKHTIPFKECVEVARKYIEGLGGFEKAAEWGLVR